MKNWLRRRFGAIIPRSCQRRAEDQLSAELHWHLQQIVREKLGSGLSPDAAEREARLQFGHVESLKERCRDTQSGAVAKALLQDVAAGLRMLAKYPLLSLASVSTTALTGAVGCTALVVIGATLWPPSSLSTDLRDVVIVFQRSGDRSAAPFSYADFLRFKAAASGDFDVAAEDQTSVVAKTGSKLDRIEARVVSDNYLQVLGTPVLYGRDFRDETTGRTAVCLVTYSFATSHFGTAANAAGQEIMVDDIPRSVIGVLPNDFRFIGDAELLLPLKFYITRPGAGSDTFGLYCFVRSTKHKSFNQLRGEIEALLKRIGRDTNLPVSGAIVRPLREMLSRNIQPQLYILGALAIVVLTIGCATAVNLNLAKVSIRWRELALRLSLGADRRRILTQLFGEEMLLALPAALCGLFAAALLLRAVRTLQFGAIHPAAVLNMSRMALFTVVLVGAFLAALAFVPLSKVVNESALATAVTLASPHLTLGKVGKRRWHTLVIAQAALTFIALGAGCLLLRDLTKLRHQETGFRHRGVFLLQLPATSKLWSDPAQTAVGLERLASSVPGVTSAACSVGVPIFYLGPVAFALEGEKKDAAHTGFAMLYTTTPQFISTLGIQLLEGRFLQPNDRSNSQPVAVVDDLFVREYFDRRSPLGKHVLLNVRSEAVAVEVVGVVRHISQRGPSRSDSEVQIYRPFDQTAPDATRDRIREGAHLVWRVSGNADPQWVATAVAGKVQELVPEAALHAPESMQDRITLALNPQRTWLMLFGFSSLVAVVLALIGIYAVTIHAVIGHARESYIRMALGCSRLHVIRTICQPIITRVLLGIAIGFPFGFVVNRLLSALMAVDHDAGFTSGALAATCTVCAGVVACLLPARTTAQSTLSAQLNVS